MNTTDTVTKAGGSLENAVRVEQQRETARSINRQAADTMNDRNDTIKAIKSALQRRSGKAWSVTGGRGTAWGWIRISAPPARCTAGHDLTPGMPDLPENYVKNDNKYPGGGASMTTADQEELGNLLGLDRKSYDSGENIAASNDYYREYIARARGETPAEIAQPYWD